MKGEGNMRIFISTFVGAFVLIGAAMPAVARDTTFEMSLRDEYKVKKEKIQQLFNDKIEKIGERSAIPEDLRQMLIQQADEVKEFDMKTLDLKLDLKLKHARQRSLIKDRLKEDAMNRVQWILDNEREFEEKKKQREDLAKKVGKDAEAPQKAEEPKPEAQPVEIKNEPVKPEAVALPEAQPATPSAPETAKPAEPSVPANGEAVSSAAENAKPEEEQKPEKAVAPEEEKADPVKINVSDQDLAEIEAVERGFLDELRYLGANDEEVNRAFSENSARIQEMKNSGATKEDIVKALETSRERIVETVKSRLSEEGGEK